MDAEEDTDEKEYSHELLKRECDTLLSEIERLEMSRGMQNKRLKNVMNLVCEYKIIYIYKLTRS